MTVVTRAALRHRGLLARSFSSKVKKDEKVKLTTGKNFRAFIDLRRVPEPYRPAKTRVRDYQEINSNPYPSSEPNEATEHNVTDQASRCMDCGTPFCQTYTGCPINNLIPEWNSLVYEGQWKQAYERLSETNNFPEFTGRVCPAPCEGACVAGLIDSPVTIKNIEYEIIDRAFNNGWVKPRPVTNRTGHKVAIIGSGPCGLACADELNQMGHTAVVFEREDEIGGLLYYGIPNMKLDKGQVKRRIDLMKEEGIEFKPNTSIPDTLSPESLLAEYSSVVLCVGATEPRKLNVPGENLNGVYFAMDFLTSNQKDLTVDKNGRVVNKWGDDVVSAEGKNVVVIGGGDTGTDCIGTSLRHYCKSLVNLEIMDINPPERNAKANPWPDYPQVYKVDYGHEESIAVLGKDPRKYTYSTTEVVDDGQGNVKAIRVVKVEKTQHSGFEHVPGTEQEIPADLVLLAMGFIGPEKPLIDAFKVRTDQRGNIQAKYNKYATTQPKVFAAGDCRRGQSLVVWAINEGRGAAKAVDNFLKEGGTN